MSTSSFHSEAFSRSHERRRFARLRLRSLDYADVGADNGGIILNLSENGVAIQAVAPLVDRDRVSLRLQPPKPRKPIAINAQITWLSESKKEAGLQFLELAEGARIEIAHWISAEGGVAEPSLPADSTSTETPQAPPLPLAEEPPPRQRKWSALFENSAPENAPANPTTTPAEFPDSSAALRNSESQPQPRVSIPEKSPDEPAISATKSPDLDIPAIHHPTRKVNEWAVRPPEFSQPVPDAGKYPMVAPPLAPPAAPPPRAPSLAPARRVVERDETTNTFVPTANEELPRTHERRFSTRQRLHALAYADVGTDNGGMVLNLSESGLALQAFNPIVDQTRLNLRIQPPSSRKRIEVTAEVAWLSDSKREAGLRFLETDEVAQLEISDWVSAEAGVFEPFPLDVSAPDQTPQDVSTPTSEERFRNWEVWTPLFADLHIEEALANEDAPESLLESSTGHECPELPPDSLLQEIFLDEPASAPESYQGMAHQGAYNGDDLTVTKSPPREPVSRGVAPPLLRFSVSRTAPPRPLFSERFSKIGTTVALCASIALVFLLMGMAFFRGWLSDRSGKVSVNESSQDAGAVPPSPAAPDHSSVAAASPSDATILKTPRAELAGILLAPRTESASPHDYENPHSENPRSATDSTGTQASSPIDAPQQSATNDSQNAGAPSMPLRPVSASGAHNLAAVAPVINPPPPVAPELRSDCYLIYRVEPLYPREAKMQRVEGTVTIHLLIGTDGRVQGLRELSGPDLLVPAALAAAREWRFIPALVNGQPRDTEKDVSIEFSLSR